jgi:hypothetical protein
VEQFALHNLKQQSDPIENTTTAYDHTTNDFSRRQQPEMLFSSRSDEVVITEEEELFMGDKGKRPNTHT